MSAWLSSIPLISPSCHAISFKYACCFDGEFVFIYLKAKNEFQIHPPVPVHQYPGIPHHQIAHHDMQQMYRNQIQNTFPYINMSPPPLSPPILPVFLQPPIKQPLPYQAFVPSPPPPQNYPQMDAQVDYNAQLLQGFNQSHGRQ